MQTFSRNKIIAATHSILVYYSDELTCSVTFLIMNCFLLTSTMFYAPVKNTIYINNVNAVNKYAVRTVRQFTILKIKQLHS